MSEGLRLNAYGATKRPLGRLACWCLRADPWPLLLLGFLLMLAYWWVYSSPIVAMFALNYIYDFILGTFLFGMLAIGRGIQLLVRNALEAQIGICNSEGHHRLWPWLLAIGAGAYLLIWSNLPIYGLFLGIFFFGLLAIGWGVYSSLRTSKAMELGVQSSRCRRRFWPGFLVTATGTCLMLWSQLPMHATFLVSRSWLDNLADEALADPSNAHRLAGRWAGFYCITGVEVVGETVILYIDKNPGSYGFARMPQTAENRVSLCGPQFPVRNVLDPEGERIAGNWFVVYSSYWRVKVGWS
jgi:hypothetical protein